MKQTGRVVVFLVAMVALVAIVGAGAWYVLRGRSTGSGEASVGLDGLPSPDFLIGLYLDGRAAELARPAGSDDSPVTFTVEPGESSVEIAQRLQAQGLVSDAELFRRYVQYHGLDVGLEAGVFTLRQTMTIPEVAQALQEARRPEQTVTIREGLRLEEVAQEVAAQTTIDAAEFLALVTVGWRSAGLPPYAFMAELPADTTLEGYLFPDTYRLPEAATALDLVSRMLETFETRVTPDVRAGFTAQGLTLHQGVALASIVEREAQVAAERPLIASVYYNRLNSGWTLSADPTTQYALGYQADQQSWWKSPLLFVDLEVESPYNTYRVTGLPPGPICSPGLASLQATAAPTATGYYFFMRDCERQDGSHLFAATDEEHMANYARCNPEP